MEDCATVSSLSEQQNKQGRALGIFAFLFLFFSFLTPFFLFVEIINTLKFPRPHTSCFGKEQFDIATVLSVYEVPWDEYRREIGFISVKAHSLPRRGGDEEKRGAEAARGSSAHFFPLSPTPSSHFLMMERNCFFVWQGLVEVCFGKGLLARCIQYSLGSFVQPVCQTFSYY